MLDHSSFSGLPSNRKQSNTLFAPGPLNPISPYPRNADLILLIEWLVPRLAKSDELLLQATYHDLNVHEGCHASFDKLGWGGFP